MTDIPITPTEAQIEAAMNEQVLDFHAPPWADELMARIALKVLVDITMDGAPVTMSLRKLAVASFGLAVLGADNGWDIAMRPLPAHEGGTR